MSKYILTDELVDKLYKEEKVKNKEIDRLRNDLELHIAAEDKGWRLYNDSLKKIEQLKSWINDLQAGMYINCVYCGHRYGPDDKVPASMADVLKEHIEQCPKHPLFEANQEIERLKEERKHEDKLKRLYLDQLADQGNQIEQLEKEKEWLIKLLYKKICATPITLDAYRRSITDLMQQELKEEVRRFDNKGAPID